MTSRKDVDSLDALFAVFGDSPPPPAAAAAVSAPTAAAAAKYGDAAENGSEERSSTLSSKRTGINSSASRQQQKRRRGALAAVFKEQHERPSAGDSDIKPDAAAAEEAAAAPEGTAAAAAAAIDTSAAAPPPAGPAGSGRAGDKAFEDAPASDGLVSRVLLSDNNCLHEVVYPKDMPTQFKDFPLQTTVPPAAAAAAAGAGDTSPVAAGATVPTPADEAEDTSCSRDTAATAATTSPGEAVEEGEVSSPLPAGAAGSGGGAAAAAEGAATVGVAVGDRVAARQWAFRLDTFQQRSVLCLEAGENVLVAAHTSAGKTVVAEYAIAMALRDKQRVVYTSPIKALSNQKYRDLCEIFGPEHVGLLTGDVSVQPDASIVVMTTEILRNMLYRGSVLIREVRWVIYDEIHYMRDRERGVVWEESIILLPAGSRLVFLSATIPNAEEFASWVAALRRQPCHVLYTEKRPTPLQHYMYPQGGEGVYLVMDEHKVFREDNFLRAVGALQQAVDQQQQQYKRQQRGKNRNSIKKIVLMCELRRYTPVIVFCFSKKECEANAQALIGRVGDPGGNNNNEAVSLTSEEERKLIAEIFQNAVNTLDEEDRQLPQIKSILPLLLRGIGIHHGGLLPFVRELIEILFQESLIRVLFSTETFSMGVNMPAKTVVFTAIRKWDGLTYRLLNGGEYIQMAGRAGRRGLDDRGIAIIMFDEQVDPEEAKGLFTGGAAPLISTFHLGFNMLLNLFRIEGAEPAFMISRSFAHFQQNRRCLGLQQEQQELQHKLHAAADIRQMVHLPEGEKEPDFDVDEAISSFYGRKHELLQQGRLLRSITMQPQYLVRFLQPGRLVSLVEDDGTDWGWATCVHKLQKRSVPSTNAHEGPIEQLLLHCLVSCLPSSVQPLESKDGGPAVRAKKPRPAPPAGEEGKDYVLEVVPFSVSCVARVSKCKMSLPAGGDVDSGDARRSISFQLQIIQDKFKDCGGLPLLDPVVDMKVDHPDLAELVSRMAASEEALRNNPFNDHPLCSLYYAAQHQRVLMQSRLRQIRGALDAQKKATIKDSLRNMRRVLHRLGFLEGDDDVVTLKGRVACEVSTADELLTSELLFSNALADLSPEELCAVLSCLVCHEKHDEPEPTEPRLLAGIQKVREVARYIARVFIECGFVWGGAGHLSEEQQEQQLQLQQQEEGEVQAVEAYCNNFKHALVSLTYGWASGQSFASLIRNTSLYEGTVIRCLRRLEELLRQLACAAKAIGDEQLEAKCIASIRQLRRGIIFSSSLYL